MVAVAAGPTAKAVVESLHELRVAAGPPAPSGLVMQAPVAKEEAHRDDPGIDADARAWRRSGGGVGLDRLAAPTRTRQKAKTRLESQGISKPMR